MIRRVITFAALAMVIIVLGGAALVIFGPLVVAPRLATPLAEQAAQALGRAVHVSSVAVTLFPAPAVRLKGIEIADDATFGDTPFVTLDRADIRVRLTELLHGDVVLDSLVLRQPHVRVIQNADGRVNVESLGQTQPGTPETAQTGGGASEAAALLGTRVQVEGGVINYLSQDAADVWTEYDVEDVALTLTAGSTVAFEGTGRLQPGDVGIDIADGTVALDGAPKIGDAPMRARMTLNARDITDLAAAVLGPGPAINGGAKGALAVAGTLAQPTASGSIEMPGVALTRTSPQCHEPQRRTLTLSTLKAAAAWEDKRFIGRPVTAELTSGTVTTNLVVVAFDRSVRIELGDLTVTALPLEKVLVDYFCEGHAVTGPLDLTGALSFNAGAASSTLSGVGQLRIGRGQVVGPQALDLLAGIVRVGGAVSALLSADLPWSLFSSPLDFDSITATYQIANGALTVRDLRYDSGAMRISGGGRYTFATDYLDLDLVVNHGRGLVYAKVTGPADSPSIHVMPTTILRDLDPGKIGHGVEDFFRKHF